MKGSSAAGLDANEEVKGKGSKKRRARMWRRGNAVNDITWIK